MSSKIEKSLVGFFPLFYNLAETGRAILIAKRYIDMGGKVIFFSHGGKYEYLAKQQGFEIIKIKPLYTTEEINRIVSVNRCETKGTPYSEKFLNQAVKEEIKAFTETKIKMLISFVNLPSAISARVSNIPLICVVPAPGKFYLKITDNFKNILTNILPIKIKIKLLNWYYLHNKRFLKPFNKIAKRYNLDLFKSSYYLDFGDITLATQSLEFISVFPNQQILPIQDYINIISLDKLFEKKFSELEKKVINKKIDNHLKSAKTSILLTMGSSGDKQIFIRILKILSKTSYKVIAVNSKILDKNEIPELNENIILLDFVPSISKINEKVSLAIIHGGQGTVYTSAYSGKPIIGIPMQFEQHLNLEKMIGHGTGIMLSKKYFKDKDLNDALDKIFENYNKYITNAKKLAKKLPPPNGDVKAAERIFEIINKK